MLKLNLCVPGRMFSGEFIDSLMATFNWANQAGIGINFWKRYNANLYLSRNMCMGSVPQNGIHQKPWQGQDYDYMLWVDSDQVWNPELIQRLINANVDVVSGLYKTFDGITFATSIKKDPKYFAKFGRFEMMTEETLAAQTLDEKTGLLKVEYTGLGFTLIKKGVWEQFEYPWFRPTMEEHIYSEEGKEDILVRDFTSDDGGMTSMFREKGIELWVDPNVRVGHQKNVIIPGDHPDTLRSMQEQMNMQIGLTKEGKEIGSSKDSHPVNINEVKDNSVYEDEKASAQLV